MRAKRLLNCDGEKRACIICGFNETVNVYHEKDKTYILCPNHHCLITRGISTIEDLLNSVFGGHALKRRAGFQK